MGGAQRGENITLYYSLSSQVIRLTNDLCYLDTNAVRMKMKA